jgi:CHAT domain-containing protein/Tfp pilus assembly protein PilF
VRTPVAALLLIWVSLLCRAQTGAVAEHLAKGDRAATENQWDKAMEAYGDARKLAAEAEDVKSEAAAMIGMAAVEYAKAHYDTAEGLARQGLAIDTKLGNQRGIADALIQIANVQYRRGDFKESRDTVERVLAIRQALADRNGVAVAFNNLGNASRQLGDKLVAIDYLSRAEREFAALGNERRRAIALNNIGIGYGELGDYERGLEYSRDSLTLAETLHDDSRIGNALNNMAVIETYRGNYRIALQLYRKALDADCRVGSPWAIAEATNNIGLVYTAQGNHEQAISFFMKTIEMNRTVGDKSLDADAHRNIGVQLLALNRLHEAAGRFRQCLDLSVRMSYRSVESEAHHDLGGVLFRMKRRSEAIAEMRKAADIQREISDIPNLAGTLAELSQMQLALGEADVALSLARQSLEMLSAVDRPETLWQAQLTAGRALSRLRRNGEAAQEFDAAIATIESLRMRIVGPPAALPVYFAGKLEPYQERVALSIAAGESEEALRTVEQSKSRALGDILRTGRVALDKALTPEERQAERRLENRLVGLNLQIDAQPSLAALKSARDNARRELDAWQSTLYAAHPETAFERGVSPPMSVDAMVRLAAETKAVILDYFIAPQRSFVFVLKPGQQMRMAALGIGQAALAARVSEFHRQLASHDLAYAASAQELYRVLIAPVARDLAGQTAVVVVPDGPLWDVPFQALEPRARHFLIEDAAISYVPSLAVLRETARMSRERRSAPAPRELLAVGDPAGHERIPEAARQVREIERLYGAQSSRVLTGEEATEASLKAEAGKYRVLHLASHAILDDANPMYSHALLAKSGSEDGVLEARELMALDLRAEVLVLSACETARGLAPAGEGINGMLWAAFVAGAPATVASLWRVESSSTAELMIGFHRHWLEARRSGTPFAKAASLAAAARQLIASATYAHPFYWAAFSVVGSPD